MESRCRKLLKQAIGIRHGHSSKATEQALKSAGFALMGRMTADEKAALATKLPDWCCEDCIRFFSWQALLCCGKKGPADICPPSARKLPGEAADRKAPL